MNSFARWISIVLIVCLSGAGVPLPAFAGIIATDQVGAAAELDTVRGFLDRQEVRAKLQSLGVDAEAARARAASLTAEEARDLAARIDAIPAGGDFLGLVFTAMIVLLVTDVLGYTKVYPFTRAVR